MTSKQKKLYWYEFGQVRENWLKKGSLTSTETDRRRHALQLKALGYEQSSVSLSNAELDRVIAVFRAEANPADFNAQMDVQDSPDRLRKALIQRCHVAMEVIGDGRSPEGYLATIAKSICGQLHWPPVDNRTLGHVAETVERRAAIIRSKRPQTSQKLTSQKPVNQPQSNFDQANPF